MALAEREIVRIMRLAVALLIAAAVLLAPTVHFLLSYERLAGSLEAEAELGSRAVAEIIAVNPDLWQYEQVRLTEYLSRRPHSGYQISRQIVDTHGMLVAESAESLQTPLITRSLPLLDSGVPVGEIRISRSLRPHILRSVTFALALVPLGVLAFLALHTVPLRAVRASQAALRRERDTAQKYLDVAGVAFVILDADGRVSLLNRKGAEILGMPESEVVGRDWVGTFVVPADRSLVASRFASAVKGEVVALEYGVLGRAGRRTVSWYVTTLAQAGEGGAGMLASGVDVTEQRQLEERLLQAQKLEAVGLLAAGVAHDFNNILSAIKGCASSVRSELAAGDPHRADLEEITEATDRAASITRSLLAFSRRQFLEPETVDLVELLRRSERRLRALVRDAQLEIELPADPLPVLADPIQIEQVIVNLVANARDAIEGAGRIAVSASRMVLDAESARRADVSAAGPYACVSVMDSGVGLDAQARASVFQPFFTTKDVGKGTGLGLAMAYGIVTEHRGSIAVTSEPGHGATFTFLLPLAETAVPSASATEDGAQGGGRIAGSGGA